AGAGGQPHHRRRRTPADLRSDGQDRQRVVFDAAAADAGHGRPDRQCRQRRRHPPRTQSAQRRGGRTMRLNIVIPLVLVALFGLMGSVYVVAEGHTAIVLNLGRVARTDIGPGLHFKWPLIENALVFDRRLHVLDATPERYLTSERKDVSVDFFAVGMIEDVRAFYRATGGAGAAAEEVAVARL